MSARDDLVGVLDVAAKFAVGACTPHEVAEAMGRLHKLRPALLALLDAEPVAWRIDGLTPSHPIFTTNKQRADLPRQRGVTVTALYARPEAK